MTTWTVLTLVLICNFTFPLCPWPLAWISLFPSTPHVRYYFLPNNGLHIKWKGIVSILPTLFCSTIIPFQPSTRTRWNPIFFSIQRTPSNNHHDHHSSLSPIRRIFICPGHSATAVHPLQLVVSLLFLPSCVLQHDYIIIMTSSYPLSQLVW